jgi:hypothetical protein
LSSSPTMLSLTYGRIPPATGTGSAALATSCAPRRPGGNSSRCAPPPSLPGHSAEPRLARLVNRPHRRRRAPDPLCLPLPLWRARLPSALGSRRRCDPRARRLVRVCRRASLPLVSLPRALNHPDSPTNRSSRVAGAGPCPAAAPTAARSSTPTRYVSLRVARSSAILIRDAGLRRWSLRHPLLQDGLHPLCGGRRVCACPVSFPVGFRCIRGSMRAIRLVRHASSVPQHAFSLTGECAAAYSSETL